MRRTVVLALKASPVLRMLALAVLVVLVLPFSFVVAQTATIAQLSYPQSLAFPDNANVRVAITVSYTGALSSWYVQSIVMYANFGSAGPTAADEVAKPTTSAGPCAEYLGNGKYAGCLVSPPSLPSGQVVFTFFIGLTFTGADWNLRALGGLSDANMHPVDGDSATVGQDFLIKAVTTTAQTTTQTSSSLSAPPVQVYFQSTSTTSSSVSSPLPLQTPQVNSDWLVPIAVVIVLVLGIVAYVVASKKMKSK
ncbi:MAG: hypothetical protein ABSC50_07595 [Candidatus Bathyarchaeia archaeon]